MLKQRLEDLEMQAMLLSSHIESLGTMLSYACEGLHNNPDDYTVESVFHSLTVLSSQLVQESDQLLEHISFASDAIDTKSNPSPLSLDALTAEWTRQYGPPNAGMQDLLRRLSEMYCLSYQEGYQNALKTA